MYKLYNDGKKSSGVISTGKGSASNRSAGGLPCNEYRRAKSFLMSCRTSAPASGSNGKNYCGSFDKNPAKKSGGKISTKVFQLLKPNCSQSSTFDPSNKDVMHNIINQHRTSLPPASTATWYQWTDLLQIATKIIQTKLNRSTWIPQPTSKSHTLPELLWFVVILIL